MLYLHHSHLHLSLAHFHPYSRFPHHVQLQNLLKKPFAPPDFDVDAHPQAYLPLMHLFGNSSSFSFVSWFLSLHCRHDLFPIWFPLTFLCQQHGLHFRLPYSLGLCLFTFNLFSTFYLINFIFYFPLNFYQMSLVNLNFIVQSLKHYYLMISNFLN